MIDAATLPAGAEFTITKTLTKIQVVTAGADLTGISTLDVSLVRAVIQNDSTLATVGTASGGIFIYTDDAVPLNSQLIGAPAGTLLVASANVGVDIGHRLTAGKKVKVKSVGNDLAGAGNVVFHLTFRRNTVGSTIAAA
jgi:hypothetical protein